MYNVCVRCHVCVSGVMLACVCVCQVSCLRVSGVMFACVCVCQVSIEDLLAQTCHVEPSPDVHIIVYDQCTTNPSMLSNDCFLTILFKKLCSVFSKVALLKGQYNSR